MEGLERHCRIRHGFVSVLFGEKSEFYLYAMLLGRRLEKLSPDVHRILLVSMIDSRWRWSLQRYLILVDVPICEQRGATSTSRHARVFTKLWVLALPIRQVLFLDLDVLPRCNPAELFQIAAPAGSYHGTLRYAVYNKNRGFSYPRDEGACFNAGVLRLDLHPNRECRHMELNDVMSRAAQIVRPSALPEQFLLAEHYHRWNLLDVSWNFEVGCSVSYDSDSGVLSEVMPSHPWAAIPLRDISMFHFSGVHVQPWWFLHMAPEEAKRVLRDMFRHRDPRGAIATAVSEWLTTMNEVLRISELEHDHVDSILCSYRMQRDVAKAWWNSCSTYRLCGHALLRADGRDQDPDCEDCQVGKVRHRKRRGGVPLCCQHRRRVAKHELCTKTWQTQTGTDSW